MQPNFLNQISEEELHQINLKCNNSEQVKSNKNNNKNKIHINIYIIYIKGGGSQNIYYNNLNILGV